MTRRRRDTTDPADQVRKDVSARAYRLKLDRWMRERSSPEYFRFRMGLIEQIQNDNLRPFEVAALLEQHVGQFVEIQADEIEAYRAMGQGWR